MSFNLLKNNTEFTYILVLKKMEEKCLQRLPLGRQSVSKMYRGRWLKDSKVLLSNR